MMESAGHVKLNRILILTAGLVSFCGTASAAMTRMNSNQQGIGYTTGPACDTLRREMAENFANKNEELFGLKDERRLVSVTETQKGTGAISVASVVVATFEQKTGSVVENVEVQFRGHKNFECDDFTVNDVSVAVTDFRLQ